MTTAISVKQQSVVKRRPDFQEILDQQTELTHRTLTAIKHGDVGTALGLLSDIESVGVNYATLGRQLKIASGQLVKFFQENWAQLPDEFVQAHTAGVYAYLQEKFGYGRQMSDIYATVWEAYYSHRHLNTVPKFVKLDAVPVGKLYDAAGYVIQHRMTEARWKVLMDSTLERTIMRHRLRPRDMKLSAGSLVKPTKNSSTQFVEETGDLTMYVNGRAEQVGFLNINSKSTPVKKEIRRIVRRSKLRSVK